MAGAISICIGGSGFAMQDGRGGQTARRGCCWVVRHRGWAGFCLMWEKMVVRLLLVVGDHGGVPAADVGEDSHV